MQANLVEFAVRTREGGRRLTFAETDRAPIGEALALLIEDPGSESPLWPAAVKAFGRIWSGYKSYEPIMEVESLLEHTLPSLIGDEQLVVAAAHWTGHELHAWALPAALVLVHRAERLYVLDEDGFAPVEPDGNLRGGMQGGGLRRDSLRLAPGDRFVLIDRRLGARIGLWRFNQALHARHLASAMSEFVPSSAEQPLILGQVDLEVALAERPRPERHTGASVEVGEATRRRQHPAPAATAVPPEARQPLAVGAAGVRAASAVRAGDTAAARATAGRALAPSGPAGPTPDDAASEATDATPTDTPAGTVVEPAATAPERVAPVVPAVTVGADRSASAAVPGAAPPGERGREGRRSPLVFTDEIEPAQPAAADQDAAAAASPRPRPTAASRSSRRATAARIQGSLFGAAATPDRGTAGGPAADAGGPPDGQRGRRTARERATTTGAGSRDLFVRGVTWTLLAVAVVVTLAAVIITVRLIRPTPGPELGPEDLPIADGQASATPTADTGRLPEIELPQLEFFRGATWARQLPAAITSSPLLVDEQVIFGCRDGHLYALGITDGATRWERKLGSGIGSSPVRFGDRVIVGTYDGNVIAVDHRNGEQLWKYETGGRIVSSPTLAGEGTVVIGSNDNTLYGLAAADGGLRWKVQTGGDIWASPAAGEGRIVTGSKDGLIYCVDGSTGHVLWTRKTGDAIYSSAAILSQRAALGSSDGTVYAVSLLDGTVLWSRQTGHPVNGSVASTGDAFVVGNDAGKLLCLEATDGTIRWSVDTSAAIKSRPRVIDEHVWVTGYDRMLHVYDVANGEERWSFKADGHLFSSPAVVGRTAFFGSMGKTFYASTWQLEEDIVATPVSASRD
ncbi:MAG: PQQ-binding-like beta-propeller repeat protein [Candidatus Eiseniibacteriota bacterium]|jgi:outer membrane protein assembly factor BamB